MVERCKQFRTEKVTVSPSNANNEMDLEWCELNLPPARAAWTLLNGGLWFSSVEHLYRDSALEEDQCD